MAVRSVAHISAESTSSNFRVETLEEIFGFTWKYIAVHTFRYCLIGFLIGSISATRPFKFRHQEFFFWGGGTAHLGARPPSGVPVSLSVFSFSFATAETASGASEGHSSSTSPRPSFYFCHLSLMLLQTVEDSGSHSHTHTR